MLNLKSIPKPTFSLFILLASLLLSSKPVLSQTLENVSADTGNVMLSDSLLSTVVLKVASYSATIDHTDFLIRRKFNVTPISMNLPEIERRVNGFKSRLEKRGNQMNFRSLNSGIIMLTEISSKLTS